MLNKREKNGMSFGKEKIQVWILVRPWQTGLMLKHSTASEMYIRAYTHIHKIIQYTHKCTLIKKTKKKQSEIFLYSDIHIIISPHIRTHKDISPYLFLRVSSLYLVEKVMDSQYFGYAIL